MINSINWIDGLDGLSTGVSLIAAVTLGIISITAAPVEPTVGLLCAVLAGRAGGLPALELPPGAHLHRHGRGDGRGLRARGAVDPGDRQGRRGAAHPGCAHHRHLLDHHPAHRVRDVARSSPTAGISTTDCSTWVCPIGGPCCSSTPSARRWAWPGSCSHRPVPVRCTRSWAWSSREASCCTCSRDAPAMRSTQRATLTKPDEPSSDGRAPDARSRDPHTQGHRTRPAR